MSGLVAAADEGGPLEEGQCTRLEAGSGDHPERPHAQPYTALAARRLHVDLDHDVSMIAFPGNIGFDSNYAIALRQRKGETWSLSYAVDAGISGTSRAFHTTVAIPREWARRVASAWHLAISGARQKTECFGFDGKSYAFSADGLQAHIWEPKSGVAGSMIEISETLKTIALDTKLTGRATRASQTRLAHQLEALERAAQEDARDVTPSDRR